MRRHQNCDAIVFSQQVDGELVRPPPAAFKTRVPRKAKIFTEDFPSAFDDQDFVANAAASGNAVDRYLGTLQPLNAMIFQEAAAGRAHDSLFCDADSDLILPLGCTQSDSCQGTDEEIGSALHRGNMVFDNQSLSSSILGFNAK